MEHISYYETKYKESKNMNEELYDTYDTMTDEEKITAIYGGQDNFSRLRVLTHEETYDIYKQRFARDSKMMTEDLLRAQTALNSVADLPADDIQKRTATQRVQSCERSLNDLTENMRETDKYFNSLLS